jgi:tryptophan synthase alpha chain
MPIEFKLKPGIVAYITAGDPDLETTVDIAIAAIDAGAEVIELGVPFSDPLADGPVIQRASERAIARGVRLLDVLEVSKKIRSIRPLAGIVIFSYLNPVIRLGLSEFCKLARNAGADGVLLTDMIVEEAADYLNAVKEFGLVPVFLAAPTSSDERLKAIAKYTQGFVYAISRLGITGTRDKLENDAETLVSSLRKFTSLPIAVGFGVSNAEHVKAIGKFADAAVIGSAIVRLIEESPKEKAADAVGTFIRGLRN